MLDKVASNFSRKNAHIILECFKQGIYLGYMMCQMRHWMYKMKWVGFDRTYFGIWLEGFKKTIQYTCFLHQPSWYVHHTGRAHLKRDGTCAETRFGLSAKRMSPFKLAGMGGEEVQFSRLLATEGCASVVVMVVMLDTPCSEVKCKTTDYPLHSHVPPSLPLLCVTVCHQVSTEL